MRGPARLSRAASGVAAAVALSLVGASLSATAMPAVAVEPRRAPDYSSEFTDSPKPRSDGASALAEALGEARSTGQRVPVEESATETEMLWANPDGTASLEIAQSPVRMRNGAGELVDIDVSLQEAGTRLRPVAAPGDVSFSRSGLGDLARLVLPGGERVSMGFAAPLGTPTLSGNLATYPMAGGALGQDGAVESLSLAAYRTGSVVA